MTKINSIVGLLLILLSCLKHSEYRVIDIFYKSLLTPNNFRYFYNR